MIYINKNLNASGGYAIVDELFQSAWNEIENTYIGLDYNGLNSTHYRERLLNLMLQEQNGICCYCMKEINVAETTIEHIIPQNINREVYLEYLIANSFDNMVIYKNDFNFNIRLIPPEQYPHDIAYHNITASCDSTSHCNNKRGNRFIIPFMYYDNITARVSFDDDGAIYSSEIMIDDSLRKSLFLNADYLRLIRKMWMLISQDYELPEILGIVEQDEKDAIIKPYRNRLSLNQRDKLQTILTERGWNDLIKYRWFYNFFR